MGNQGLLYAIDMGYGRIKLSDSQKRVTIIPTYMVKAPTVNDTGFMANDDYVIIGGKKYYVGEKALSYGFQESLIHDDYHGSQEWVALLVYALYKHGKKYETDIVIDKICVGLPISQYDNKERRAKVTKAMYNLKANINKTEIVYPIADKSLKLMPQGVGAYMQYQDKIDQRTDCDGVVDIGKRTVDLALFNDGRYVPGSSESKNRGVDTFHKSLVKRIKNEFGMDVNMSTVEKALATSSITISGQPRDISKIIQVLKEEYRDLIVNTIKEVWTEQLVGIQRIIFIGGGAEIIKEHLNNDSRYVVMEDPGLANVFGYITYLQNFGGNP